MNSNLQNELNNILDNMLDNGFTQEECNYTLDLVNACIVAYLKGSRVSYTHWQEQTNRTRFNLIVRLFGDLGWLRTIVANNFATIELKETKLLEYMTAEEISDIRLDYLVNCKVLKFSRAESSGLSATRMPTLSGGTTRVKVKNNIIRDGFRHSGNVPFKFDTGMLASHRDEFQAEITKGLLEKEPKELTDARRKPLAKTDYREIVKGVFDVYLDRDTTYTLGENISDGRGRAVYDALKLVGNPISSKLFRSIVKLTPRKLQSASVFHVFNSIADLAGTKYSTLEDKTIAGKQAYEDKAYTHETYENIWLERLYKGLDKYYKYDTTLWDVPLELDVNSSMMTNTALILNDHAMMRECNLIEGQVEIKDPWYVAGVPRQLLKKCMTPRLYGSSAKLRKALVDEDGNFDYEAVMLIQEELTKGKFKAMDNFKQFILSNCNTQEKMQVSIDNEHFEIYCNRFKWDSTNVTETFMCWDNEIFQYIPVTRSVKRVPDLTTFNLYMVTLLLHNLDSQIANYICSKVDCLPIHDAFLIHPNDVNLTKKVYLEKITSIYKNRKTILDNYFRSIGITKEFAHNTCEELELSANSLR